MQMVQNCVHLIHLTIRESIWSIWRFGNCVALLCIIWLYLTIEKAFFKSNKMVFIWSNWFIWSFRQTKLFCSVVQCLTPFDHWKCVCKIELNGVSSINMNHSTNLTALLCYTLFYVIMTFEKVFVKLSKMASIWPVWSSWSVYFVMHCWTSISPSKKCL